MGYTPDGMFFACMNPASYEVMSFLEDACGTRFGLCENHVDARIPDSVILELASDGSD